MKRHFLSPLLLVILLGSMSAGFRPASPPDQLLYPVNMTLAEGRLYVSDEYTGVHVFDVSDLSAPRRVMRIPLQGNRGTAVKDDIVFAGEYGALHAIRITGETYSIVATIGEKYKDYGVIDQGMPPDGGFACACTSGEQAYAPMSSGGYSSYATFALAGDHLYRIDEGRLLVYDVSVPEQPKEVARPRVGWDIETIHPAANLLFLGGRRGMYIFDRTDPLAPLQVGQVEHARACDPVVVSGSTAYVTLRGGSQCGAAPDELLCVNIEEPWDPRVVAVKPLATPWGLVVREPHLFVSNGESGYSLLDVSRPEAPSPTAVWTDWATRDFIWSGDTLFVLGTRDLRIFDVRDPSHPVLLSRIEAATS